MTMTTDSPTGSAHVRLQLRPYQHEALQRVAAAEARGVRRQMGVAATGLGKTVMFCSLAERRGGRTLVLAHRDELISQAAAKVLEVWPGADVGVVKADRDDVDCQVVVASVQTLARPQRLRRLVDACSGGSLLRDAGPFNTVVVDEAHHAAADSYRSILRALHAGTDVCSCGHDRADHHAVDLGGSTRAVACGDVAWEDGGCPCAAPEYTPGPLLLGVTATPDRGDGKGLDDLFDEITFTYDILWGIRAGYLSDLRGLAVRLDRFDVGEVKVRAGEYDAGQAGHLMLEAGAPDYIVRAWREHAADRRTLVFTPTVEMAGQVADAYTAAGVAAGMVHGGTPLDERRRLLAAFEAGHLQVMTNCAVLTEGYDNPRVDCVVVARPTKSRALYTQMIGRGTRRHPDKADCLVLDVVGASDEHSLCTVPSLFGIDKRQFPDLETAGRPLTAVVEAHEAEQVRLGRMRAEDADLFRKMRAEGIAWVPIHSEGEPLRRYVRTCGKDRPTVVLAQRPTGWLAGLHHPNGAKKVLIHDVDMETAQGVGEDWIRRFGGGSGLHKADAPWRARKPSAKQRALAKRWKVTVDPSWSAGQLSDAIDAKIARIRQKRKATRP